MSEQFRFEKDPAKALEYFRALPEEDQLTAVFAETSILRYELRLIEEFIRIFRRLFWPLLAALALLVLLTPLLVALAVGNRSIGQQIQDCTTPDTPCTDRLRDDSGTLCVVIALQNDNRLVNAYDPDHDGAVNLIPTPRKCT